MADELPPSIYLMQVMFGFAASRAVGVAAELGIADLLEDGPKSAGELSRRTRTHERSLYRVLRACASVGIFSEDADKRFRLTPPAESLLSAAPGSLRSFVTLMTNDFQYQTWAGLLYSVQTGEPAFGKAIGTSSASNFWNNEKAGNVFDDAMSSNSAFSSAAVLSAYDFSSVSRLVDVGGGHGRLLAAILKKYPALRGTLYDTPAIVEAATDLLQGQGVADRCEQVGGNFFEAVPPGGDAYLLKHIIHDWNDEQSLAILKNCRDAMSPHGKVLVVEMVLPAGNEPSFGKFLDLQMLLYLRGGERTEAEYRQLFDGAGLVLTRTLSTTSPVSILEGTRK